MALRQLKNRIIRQRIRKEAVYHIETRDAILWDIIDNKRCRVKILGSDTLLVANYPENQEKNPVWLKPGNAVRIQHAAGNRHKIEVIGNGFAVPTPMSGSAAPTPPTPQDAIISGLTLSPAGGMFVAVRIGQVRFSGAVFNTGYFTADSNLYADSDIYADTFAAVKVINAAPAAGTYRYDIIVIGSDLVIDYVAGTASASPAMPAAPTGHLLCGYLLVAPGTTSIKAGDIGKKFSQGRAASLTVVVADNDLAWDQLSTTITVTVKDQYGNTFNSPSLLSVEFVSGNGTLSIGTQSSSTKVTSYLSSGSAIITYTRGHADPGDVSPVFKVILEGTGLVGFCNILLRNADEMIM
ncbi:MAG: hypothetical protein EHM79_02170 [Geobacter sp.]|nr:MAG: hypothetical protein EHM79_02170 [Geobacter sp.]